jgi:isopentenyldiphosphate isomerase
MLHPVVHLHLFNERGMLYLQKRAGNKDIQPNMWDTSVGGHVDFGEDIDTALMREAGEELGLGEVEARFLFRYVHESEVERELVYAFYAVSTAQPEPDPAEISEGRFWSREEIVATLGKGIFTPNFEGEILRVLESVP